MLCRINFLARRSFHDARLGLLTLLSAIGLGLGLSSWTGCAHYQLGSEPKTKFASLFIAPVTSSVSLPQAQVLLTTQLRAAFIRDGRVTLTDSADTAEASLHLTLADYHRAAAVARRRGRHDTRARVRAHPKAAVDGAHAAAGYRS